MITVKPEIVATGGDTCGPDCWYAKCPTCKCCCGGKNHGVLRMDNREVIWEDNPIGRTKRVGDTWYYLAYVGRYDDPDLLKTWQANRRPIIRQRGGALEDVELYWHSDFIRQAGGILQTGYKLKPNWPETRGYSDDDLVALLWVRA